MEILVAETSTKEKRMSEERHRFETERKELMEQIRELKKQSTQPQLTLTKPNESNGKAPTETPELSTISPTPFPRPVHNYPPVGIDHEPYLRPRKATELIPKFNGYNIPLHQFINLCEDVAQSLTAYPAPDVLKNIKRRLVGDAERLTYGMDFLTIDSFTQTIKTIFSQQKTFDEYRGELINLKQRPHKNVTQYAARTLELRDSLLNSLRDQNLPRLDYSVAQEEVSILERFVKGLLQQIRIELRQAGYRTIVEAIGKAKTLEKELDITYDTKNPTDDRRQIVRNEIRTYQKYIRSNNDYDQIQNRRYDYGQPRLEHRNSDSQYNSNIENRNHNRNYNPNMDDKSFNRERAVNNYSDRQRNLPSRPFPEDRRDYYQRPEEYQNMREYRNQRDYRNTRDYRSPRAEEYSNQRDHVNQRTGNYRDDRNFDAYRNPSFPNTYAPPAAYEPERLAPRTNDPPTGTRIAQVIQPELNWCKLSGIPRVVKARIKPNTPVTLLIDTGSQLNLIKEHLLAPGTTITGPYDLPLQGIGEGMVGTLGTVTLEIFSRKTLFHIVPRSMPTPGDGILGDEFFMDTGVTINYIKQHIHFQDIYVPFYDGESVVIGARETRQIKIMILNPEVKEGILNRHESMPGLYIEKTIVRHEEGRIVVKVVIETDREIVIKVPTLAISPLEEGVTPVVRKLEDGKATSGVDSHTNETAPGKKPLIIATCEDLATKKYDEDSFIEIYGKKELEIDEEKNKSFIEACRELGSIESDEFHEELTDARRTAIRLDEISSDAICELDNAASVVDTRVNQHSGGADQIEIRNEVRKKNDSEIIIGSSILEPGTEMNYLVFCNLSTETTSNIGSTTYEKKLIIIAPTIR
ncbi:hypothetical protein M0802_015868 [Mischocyttarus mexicanus]|nr:hypothetical protein M0802_015868 [Mischocyttarus mexicanus]